MSRPEIVLRAARDSDRELLIAVYASTRTRDLELLARRGVDAKEFLAMQFEAQSRHYATFHPRAVCHVVMLDDEPAGRLMVDRGGSAIEIIEMSLLPQFRRRGVGSRLVGEIFAESDSLGVPVRCEVALDNEALRFWERLGFTAGESDGVHVRMERVCAISPS